MFRIKVLEEIKTHVSVFFFEKSCRFGDDVEKYFRAGEGHMTIWRMRIACWITKATNTHSQYVIIIAFPVQQWLQKRASKLCLYIHCLSCYVIEIN